MRSNLVALLVACAATAVPSLNAAEWKPDKRVEIVVPATPGGGNDRVARMVQKVMQDRRLVDVITTVVNKPGAGGVVAYTYLNQNAGSGHHLAIATVTLLTNHISGRSVINYTDLTPVGQLYSEYLVFATSPESKLKTGKDLIAAVRSDPASIGTALAGGGNHNHIALGLLARAAGADMKKLKAVTFNSGSEATMAVIGRHVDLLITPGATAIPHAAAGRLRIIAIAAPARASGVLSEVPTWREQGANVVVSNSRSIVGPRGMTGQQVAYWENVLSRVVQTDEWKKMLEHDVLSNDFLRSAETRERMRSEYETLKGVLAELGKTE